MASGGYPSAAETGKRIYGLEEDFDRNESTEVFHAGTKLRQQVPSEGEKLSEKNQGFLRSGI